MIEKTTKTETVTTYRVNSAQVLDALVLAGIIPIVESGAEVAVEAITPYGVGDRSGDAFDIDENAHNWSGGLRITVKVVAQSTETGEPEVPKAEGAVVLLEDLFDNEHFRDTEEGDDVLDEIRFMKGVSFKDTVTRPASEPKVRTRNPSPHRPKT